MATIGFGQAMLAVAGDEHEGQAASGQNFRDRKDLLAVDIDVENGGGEIAGSRLLARLGHGADRRGHVVAEVGEHVLQQHADQILILDDKKARHRSRGFVHRHVPVHNAYARRRVPSKEPRLSREAYMNCRQTC